MTSQGNRDRGGEGVRHRVKRGAIWTFLEFGGAQLLRLASNLVLTRLLMPEAFGMMALVEVFLMGIGLFSDTGIKAAIVQNPRGDDRAFLDTAWTIQAIRGAILWIATAILAIPAARLYGEPMLAQLLPVAGLSFLATGFTTTALYTANRHIRLGRVTLIGLLCQGLTLLMMAALAMLFQSVWALVAGRVIGAVLRVLAFRLWLPDARNGFRLEREAVGQMFRFGKFIFLSTAAGFVLSQADRAVLGFHISLGELGVYNIGFFLANVPVVLAKGLRGKIVFPIYRMKPIRESPQNRRAVFRMRRLLAGGMLGAAALLAFGGPALVELLYDPRYLLAGYVITLYSLTLVPVLALDTAPMALLSEGDSRRYFYILGSTALLQLVFILVGIEYAGLFGVILAPGLAVLASYPLRVVFARRYGAWDPLHDMVFFAAGVILCGTACVLHWGGISQLLP